MSASIRRYLANDLDDVYDVCVRTGAAGQDARGRYSTDLLLGDIYAGPYLHIAPEHAYVLDSGDRAVGYVIGTPNTQEFVAAYLADWLPRMHDLYAPPATTPTSDEEQKLAEMFGIENILRPELAPYPAHLHINLLPDFQGAGHGRTLMATFLASVAAAGARWCHLVVRTTNVGALRFYDRLGWRRIEVANPGPSVFLVKPTAD